MPNRPNGPSMPHSGIARRRSKIGALWTRPAPAKHNEQLASTALFGSAHLRLIVPRILKQRGPYLERNTAKPV